MRQVLRAPRGYHFLTRVVNEIQGPNGRALGEGSGDRSRCFFAKPRGLQQPSAELPGTGRAEELGGRRGWRRWGGSEGLHVAACPGTTAAPSPAGLIPGEANPKRRIPRQPPAALQCLACSSKSAQAAPEAQASSDAEGEGGGSGNRKKKIIKKSEIKELLFHFSPPSISTAATASTTHTPALLLLTTTSMHPTH